MSDSQRFVDKVAKWLESAGYPLEMKVARQFREAGFAVGQAQVYKDPVLGKIREIDVIGRSNVDLSSSMSLGWTIVIECKMATSRPWILLCTTEPATVGLDSRYQHANDAMRTLLANIDAIEGLTGGGVFLGPERVAYAASVLEKEGADEVYSAVQALESALENWTDGLSTAMQEGRARSRGGRYLELKTGLLVVQGPIAMARLDEKGELVVEETQTGRIRWGTSDIVNNRVPIDVVRLDALSAYVERVSKDVAALTTALSRRPELATDGSIGLAASYRKYLARRTPVAETDAT